MFTLYKYSLSIFYFLFELLGVNFTAGHSQSLTRSSDKHSPSDPSYAKTTGRRLFSFAAPTS